MKLIRKLFLSILSIIFAFVSLTTSTYAWFSTTTINYVDGLELNVVSTELIEISLDGENYYYSITSDMVYEALGKTDIAFDNITTTNQNVFTSKNGEIVEPNSDYLTLTIWFRTSEMSSKALFLENNVSNIYNYNYVYEHQVNGTYVISSGLTLLNDTTYNDSSDVLVIKGEQKKYFADEAIRIGVKELNVDNKNLLDPDSRTSDELKQFIFDPSENEQRGFGKTFGAYDYFSKKTGMDLKLPETFPTTIYELTTFKNPYEANNDNSQVATYQLGIDENGKKYYYAKIQLNIWLEGWDADCMDGIMYDSILMQLSFTGASLAR